MEPLDRRDGHWLSTNGAVSDYRHVLENQHRLGTGCVFPCQFKGGSKRLSADSGKQPDSKMNRDYLGSAKTLQLFLRDVDDAERDRQFMHALGHFAGMPPALLAPG